MDKSYFWISFIVPVTDDHLDFERVCKRTAVYFGFVVTESAKRSESYDRVMAAQRRRGFYKGARLVAIILVCPPPGEYGEAIVVRTPEELEVALRKILAEACS